jgi:predicted Fe-Mo cluster-binding NifX family protein
MRVCFPVLKADGLESKVYGHFGSAPAFIVVDTVNNGVTTINNKDQHHQHGSCNPMKAFDNQKLDAVVVGGIGGGALNKLNQLGIKVFHANGATVSENITLLKANDLKEFAASQCCSGHGRVSGCGH